MVLLALGSLRFISEAEHADLLERQDVAEQAADELLARHAAVHGQLAHIDAELPRLPVGGLRAERAAIRSEWRAAQQRAGPLRQAQLEELRAAGAALRREIADGYDQRTAAERHEWLVKATTQQHHAKRRLEQLFNSS